MPDHPNWLAECAMHRVLRRTLPAQRHEVLGALSALKLQLALARRRAGRGETEHPDHPPTGLADAATPLAQLEAMAEQQLAAQTALIELRLWDGVAAQRRALDEVITQCLGWVRQAAAIAGHQLGDLVLHAEADWPDGEDPADALPWVDVPAAHYLVLAQLYASLDRLDRPAQLTPHLHSEPEGWRLVLQTVDRTDGATPAWPRSPRGDSARAAGQAVPEIDASMLSALAVQCSHTEAQWQVTTDADQRAAAALPQLRLHLLDAAA